MQHIHEELGIVIEEENYTIYIIHYTLYIIEQEKRAWTDVYFYTL